MAGFFDYTSAIPRPPEGPEDPTQAALKRAVQARHDAKMEAWDVKHTAWLQAQADRKQARHHAAVAAHIEQFRAAQEAAYARAGVGPAEFRALWPQLLRDHQVAAANADPLEDEKTRLRTQANYSM